jgi:hypothetical protein
MERTAAVVLRWTGRFFILLAVFILVCSLFLPSAVQPLNPLVCPDGTELDNARYALPGGPDNARLELVCTSAGHTESAAKKVLLVAISLVVVGLVALYFSERMVRPKYRAPSTPQMR